MHRQQRKIADNHYTLKLFTEQIDGEIWDKDSWDKNFVPQLFVQKIHF
jgi:hypothetical protein